MRGRALAVLDEPAIVAQYPAQSIDRLAQQHRTTSIRIRKVLVRHGVKILRKGPR